MKICYNYLEVDDIFMVLDIIKINIILECYFYSLGYIG